MSRARDLSELPQGDGDVTVDGNVGIGTATPASPLHIFTSTNGAQDLLTISSGYNNPSGQQAIAWKDPAGNTMGKIGVEYSASSGGALTFGSLYSGGSNTTERMRIDSSGNLLVNKTSTNTLGNVGHDFAADGYVMHTRASSNVMYLNRTTSDGSIAEFYKDGAKVGSIGTGIDSLTIGKGNTQLLFWDAQSGIFPSNGTTVTDNSINFGNPNYRFKDLYLSGGVHLGGTGSANKLDDYEEGTWTPVLAGQAGDAVSNIQDGFYTKIGNLVTLTGTYTWSSSGSNANVYTKINGFPFACSSDTNSRGGGSAGAIYGIADSDGLVLVIDPGQTYAFLINREGAGYSHNNTVSADGAIYGFTITYRTDA